MALLRRSIWRSVHRDASGRELAAWRTRRRRANANWMRAQLGQDGCRSGSAYNPTLPLSLLRGEPPLHHAAEPSPALALDPAGSEEPEPSHGIARPASAPALPAATGKPLGKACKAMQSSMPSTITGGEGGAPTAHRRRSLLRFKVDKMSSAACVVPPPTAPASPGPAGHSRTELAGSSTPTDLGRGTAVRHRRRQRGGMRHGPFWRLG